MYYIDIIYRKSVVMQRSELTKNYDLAEIVGEKESDPAEAPGRSFSLLPGTGCGILITTAIWKSRINI